jgi:hypothetical protein
MIDDKSFVEILENLKDNGYDLSKLKVVTLMYTNLTDSGIDVIVKNLPNVSRVNIFQTAGMTKKGIFKLKALNYLTMLTYSGDKADTLTREEIIELTQDFKYLKHLTLNYPAEDDMDINDMGSNIDIVHLGLRTIARSYDQIEKSEKNKENPHRIPLKGYANIIYS